MKRLVLLLLIAGMVACTIAIPVLAEQCVKEGLNPDMEFVYLTTALFALATIGCMVHYAVYNLRINPK